MTDNDYKALRLIYITGLANFLQQSIIDAHDINNLCFNDESCEAVERKLSLEAAELFLRSLKDEFKKSSRSVRDWQTEVILRALKLSSIKRLAQFLEQSVTGAKLINSLFDNDTRGAIERKLSAVEAELFLGVIKREIENNELYGF